jgi:hypothetical protein
MLLSVHHTATASAVAAAAERGGTSCNTNTYVDPSPSHALALMFVFTLSNLNGSPSDMARFCPNTVFCCEMSALFYEKKRFYEK